MGAPFMIRGRMLGGAVLLAGIAAGGLVAAPAPRVQAAGGIESIKHVIVIMQENRSFDHYFGTYPGAAGIPRDAGGVPTVCNPDPRTGQCVKPYHDPADQNWGGPHTFGDANKDIDGGKMDGFIKQAETGTSCAENDPNPSCGSRKVDVMGYHDRHELPLYWSYADQFVLQDHMFEPNLGWSLPSHLFMVSAWSASCASPNDPATCQNDPRQDARVASNNPSDYAWTDLTYLLHRARVSWGYFIAAGGQPDCGDDQAECAAGTQDAGTPSIWNPLPSFTTVKDDGEAGNVQDVTNFLKLAAAGNLPAVSWVIPDKDDSEHPSALVSKGQAYVKSLVDAVAHGPDWSSSAILISWDDWGGFYDHIPPPVVDGNGWGIRVPGLVISPYAKKGYIDHQTLSFDAYLKFIEDDFLRGRRIDPRNDGRPDPRPDVRESERILGDLAADFDFSQPPRRLTTAGSTGGSQPGAAATAAQPSPTAEATASAEPQAGQLGAATGGAIQRASRALVPLGVWIALALGLATALGGGTYALMRYRRARSTITS